MALPKPFTNQIEHAGAGPARIPLFLNGSIVLVEELIHYDEEDFFGCVPCNALAEDPNEEYLSDPLLSSDGGEIQLPNILAGWAGGGDAPLEGLKFGTAYSQEDAVNFGVELDNEYVGINTSRLQWKNYTKAKLGSSSENIVDSQGPAYGLTINIINNKLELPDWDRFFNVDTYLENSKETCISSSYGLSTDKHCEVCEERRWKYIANDLHNARDCFRDACKETPNYRGDHLSYICSDNDEPSEVKKLYIFTDIGSYDCYCLESGDKLDYYPSTAYDLPVGSTVVSTEVLEEHTGADSSRAYCLYEIQTPTELRTFDTSLASVGLEDGEIINLKKDCTMGPLVEVGDVFEGSTGEAEFDIDDFNPSLHADLAIVGYHIVKVDSSAPDGVDSSGFEAANGEIIFHSINDNTKKAKIAWNSSAPNDTQWIIVLNYTYSECTATSEGNLKPDPSAFSKFYGSEAVNKEFFEIIPCDFTEEEKSDKDLNIYWDYEACDTFDVEPGPRGGENDNPEDDACFTFNHIADSVEWESCKEQYAYITEKYWNCYDDCGSSDGRFGTPCFNGSYGENRVDIASDICHCGGKYKGQDTKCGWKAIMNKIPYSF